MSTLTPHLLERLKEKVLAGQKANAEPGLINRRMIAEPFRPALGLSYDCEVVTELELAQMLDYPHRPDEVYFVCCRYISHRQYSTTVYATKTGRMYRCVTPNGSSVLFRGIARRRSKQVKWLGAGMVMPVEAGYAATKKGEAVH